MNSNLLAVDVTGGKTREDAVVESLKRNNDDVLKELPIGLILAANKGLTKLFVSTTVHDLLPTNPSTVLARTTTNTMKNRRGKW